MQYKIHEDNMARLEKKLNTIKAKCAKYGCEFRYEKVGEVYEPVEIDGNVVNVKYIVVEASGIAKVNGWEFVATIEHKSTGNVIRAFNTEVTVPEKYYTTGPVCEHCKTNKKRKDTYLVYNASNGEFKQVGKSCLKDFTNGLSAEAVARYISFFDELIAGESCQPGTSVSEYYEVEDVILHAVEAVNIYGYRKSVDEFGSHNYESTRDTVMDFYHHNTKYREKHINKGFNLDREGNKEKAKAIMDFVGKMENKLGYISNLKTICAEKYCSTRDFGIVCSAVACYDREMDRMAAKKKAEEENSKLKNEWYGNVGERVTIDGVSTKLLTSFESDYGVVYIYRFVSDDGHVFTWKTGKSINVGNVSKVVGTIKSHNEYKGMKQTEMTRCKVS